MPDGGINLYIDHPRSLLSLGEPARREVYFSGIQQGATPKTFSYYLADKAPTYYRRLEDIIGSIRDGGLLSMITETMSRMPTAESFQESHAGEIIASLFASEHLKLVPIYSKLRRLTAENANAFKMDLVLCDPTTNPLTFILGEVKSSMKVAHPTDKPKHDGSCYSSLFRSLQEYSLKDEDFDLTAARDALDNLAPDLAEKVRKALAPYGTKKVTYAAFVVIDRGTFLDEEARVLGTRDHEKSFNVDVIAVEGLQATASAAFQKLQSILKCSL